MKKLFIGALLALISLGASAQATLEDQPQDKIERVTYLNPLINPTKGGSALSIQKRTQDSKVSYILCIITYNEYDDDAFCFLGDKTETVALLKSLVNAINTKEYGHQLTLKDHYGQKFNVVIYNKSADIQPTSEYRGTVIKDDFALIQLSLLEKAIALIEK